MFLLLTDRRPRGQNFPTHDAARKKGRAKITGRGREKGEGKAGKVGKRKTERNFGKLSSISRK